MLSICSDLSSLSSTGVTYVSEQRLLPQSADQPFGVHVAQPQDVQRTTIYSNDKRNIYTGFHTVDILGRLGGASIRSIRSIRAAEAVRTDIMV